MKIRTLITVSAIALAAVITLSGCEKEQPAPPQEQDHSGHDHAAMTQEGAAADDTAVAATDTEQTVCPVMGGKINKEFFTEYKGKKVYFCCPSCKPEFEKNPEKYIGKLPQFKDE
jgi:YHS domain-containing protein